MTGKPALPDWEEYQQSFQFSPDVCATIFSSFAHDSTRLFVKDTDKLSVETWEAQKQRSTPPATNAVFGSADAINGFIKRCFQGSGTFALNIPQATSWSRLNSSFQTFAHICNVLKVSPSFLEIASTFGFRREDSDNFFNSSLWRAVSPSTSKKGATYGMNIRGRGSNNDRFMRSDDVQDICYNIRHVGLHNRTGPEPWSHRNFAVYHRYYHPGKSFWLYINLPEAIKEQVALMVVHESRAKGHALFLHLAFLRFSVGKWRHYINYLEGKVLIISKAVAFIRLDNRTGVDFEVNFSSGQKLSALRQKIERSIATIHSYRGIAKTLQELSSTLCRKNSMSEEETEYMAQAMNELLQTTDGYIKKLEALMRSCNFTADLLFQFLELRNNAAARETTSMLKVTMEASTAEMKTISWLIRKSCADTRGTKITARIALMYAPAALIAVCFNSLYSRCG